MKFKNKIFYSSLYLSLLYISPLFAQNQKTEKLFEAVKSNNTQLVKELIDHKSDLNVQDELGNTPLMFAADKGYQEIVVLLIKNKADIKIMNNLKWTPLMKACGSGHTNSKITP